MAELARGTVFDRPWGRTLGALGLRGLTGQLTLTAVDFKNYEIAFANGAVVGASSPVASDAAVRVALTGGLISTTQVSDLARKQAASPGRDEVDVLTEHLKLSFDQSMRLRRRTIAQKAARTFAVDKGEFVVRDEVTLNVVAGSELDIRAIIYYGAKQNLPEHRLASELGLFGQWFRLKPEAFEDLPQFGFSEAERPIIDALMNGASLGDLEGIVGMDGRTVRATLYALCAANACNVEQTRGGGTTKPPPGLRQSDPGFKRGSGSDPGLKRPPTEPGGVQRGSQAQPPRTNRPTQQPLVAYRPGIRRTSGGSAPPPNTTQTPVSASTLQPPTVRATATTAPRTATPTAPRSTTPTAQPRTATPPPSPSKTIPPRTSSGSSPPTNANLAAQVPEVQKLIAQRAKQIDQGADFYALLGVTSMASAEEIRKIYFGLARQLHPDRLSALGIADETHVAHKVFAQLNTAFATLSDTKRRADYDEMQNLGGSTAQAAAEELAMKILASEEAYKKGEMALKRDDLGAAITELARAIELNPNEADFQALHAWAMFCATSDKAALARKTRATMEHAIEHSPRAINPRFYLGRVERMLGNDARALELFKEVLRDKPYHQEAQSEVRVIEQRLAQKTKKR